MWDMTLVFLVRDSFDIDWWFQMILKIWECSYLFYKYIIIVTIALWEKMPVPVTSIWLIAMYQNVNIILLINVSTGFMNQNPNKRIDRNMPTSKANLSSLIYFINDIDTIHILIFSSYLCLSDHLCEFLSYHKI